MEEFSWPSMNVVLELLLACFLHLGCSYCAKDILSIHPNSEENRIVSLSANSDFMIFNPRAKVLTLKNLCGATDVYTFGRSGLHGRGLFVSSS